MGFWDNIKSGIQSAWEWVKGAIQRVWARFKVFIQRVADWARTVIGALKELVKKAMRGISNLKEKIKQGLKKFFLIITRKSNSRDSFKETIKIATGEGKVGNITVSGADVFDDVQTAEYDYHIVQTDSEFNTENVHSISAEQVTDDLRRRTASAVTELNISF